MGFTKLAAGALLQALDMAEGVHEFLKLLDES